MIGCAEHADKKNYLSWKQSFFYVFNLKKKRAVVDYDSDLYGTLLRQLDFVSGR